MLCPVIQKIIFSKKAFVERRLPRPGEGKFFVKRGNQVRPFDFVAEIKDGVRQRLTAGVGGEIVKLLPEKAVLIETAAVVIRGVVGCGEDSEGEVRIAATYNEPIRLEAVEAKCAGNILIGGFVPTLEVFKKAEAVGVKGVVCGGADFYTLSKIQLPTLLTEGFGQIPLNRQVFDFLKKVGGRHVFLSPEREELLVARYADGQESEEAKEVFAEIKEGMMVEVFSAGHFGWTGKVEKVVGDEVEVMLDSGDKIIVPGRNIGILK